MTLGVFIFLLFLSGFFSGTETAYFSLHKGKVRLMREQRLPNALLVERLKKDPERLLITILIGNNIVNIFTASLATVVAAGYFESGAVGIATGVTTFLILLFGEIVPKSLAITHAERIARLVAKPLYVLYLVFYPVTYLFMELTTFLSRVFGAGADSGSDTAEAEVRIMARMGVESGDINYREHEMIENVFSFDDITIETVMTPIYKTELLNGTTPIDQIAYFASQSVFSRFPVYDDNDTDDIIGFVHINTIARVLNSDERDRPLRDFVSAVAVVGEDEKIERVFRLMKRTHEHMCLVHHEDNPKKIIGIVTLEDLLEQIVGDIHDEADAMLRMGEEDTSLRKAGIAPPAENAPGLEYPLLQRK